MYVYVLSGGLGGLGPPWPPLGYVTEGKDWRVAQIFVGIQFRIQIQSTSIQIQILCIHCGCTLTRFMSTRWWQHPTAKV